MSIVFAFADWWRSTFAPPIVFYSSSILSHPPHPSRRPRPPPRPRLDDSSIVLSLPPIPPPSLPFILHRFSALRPSFFGFVTYSTLLCCFCSLEPCARITSLRMQGSLRTAMLVPPCADLRSGVGTGAAPPSGVQVYLVRRTRKLPTWLVHRY